MKVYKHDAFLYKDIMMMTDKGCPSCALDNALAYPRCDPISILVIDSGCIWLQSILFQLGLHFVLRAVQKNRNLRVKIYSPISILIDAPGVRYLEDKEDVSKTNRGGLQPKHLTPKVTRAYRNKSVPERCPVLTYKKNSAFKASVMLLFILQDVNVTV